MTAQERAYKEGTVEEALPSTLFRVRFDDGETIPVSYTHLTLPTTPYV